MRGCCESRVSFTFRGYSVQDHAMHHALVLQLCSKETRCSLSERDVVLYSNLHSFLHRQMVRVQLRLRHFGRTLHQWILAPVVLWKCDNVFDAALP